MVLMYIRYVYPCLHQETFGIGTHSDFIVRSINQQTIRGCVTVNEVRGVGDYIVNKLLKPILEQVMVCFYNLIKITIFSFQSFYFIEFMSTTKEFEVLLKKISQQFVYEITVNFAIPVSIFRICKFIIYHLRLSVVYADLVAKHQ